MVAERRSDPKRADPQRSRKTAAGMYWIAASTGITLRSWKLRCRYRSLAWGLDISKDAARRAARQWPQPAFSVVDLWDEWPVNTGKMS